MAIQIEALTHRYPRGHRTIFEGASATFAAGSIHGLFGDNGCGKTTLLRLIAGLEHLQRGTIHIQGKPVTQARVREEGIVYVASKPVMLTGSVLQNAIVALQSRGLTPEGATAVVTPLLEQLDLWRLRDQSAHTLSSGECQKLALVRALALKPSVLMVDEPTGNVDIAMTSQAESMIKDLVQRTGATVLLVSHDPEQLRRLADCHWQLMKGDIQTATF